MTAPAAWWPVATRRPVPNTASPHPGEGAHLYDVAGLFTHEPLGWAFHVVVGNGSPYGTFVSAKSPRRRFSHLWFAKDGGVEQYGPFTHKSWAQGTGNGDYYSAETEGYPEEPLTAAQIQRLAEWHVWSRTADKIAADVGDTGIVCHFQGGADWGAHSCPDPAPGGQGPRSHQRAAILATARTIRTHEGDDDMPTLDEIGRLFDAKLAAHDKALIKTLINFDLGHPGGGDTVGVALQTGFGAAVRAAEDAAAIRKLLETPPA